MLELTVKKKLRDFSLDVHVEVKPGMILALMGDNGAGKSTILNLVAGLITPDSGSITLNGTVICDTVKGVSLPVEKRRIGYVLQNPAVFPHMSVRDNIAYGPRAEGLPAGIITGRVDHWLEKLEIHDLANVKAGSLSGGQRQRVALARALATEPSLLMLDEPFTALDADSMHSVKQYIRTFVTDMKIPCLIVTHRILDSKEIGDQACILFRGEIEWAGNPSDFPLCSCRERIVTS
jgi:molybdate transport system ATP-binding protein